MRITINIDDYQAGFINADELENLLQKIGERITNGIYKNGSRIEYNNKTIGFVGLNNDGCSACGHLVSHFDNCDLINK